LACLDTDVLVDLTGRSGRALAQRAIASVLSIRGTGEEICTTRFNAAELYLGVELSNDRRRQQLAVQSILSRMRVLDFDDRAARQYARIVSILTRLGLPIGEVDSLIASVALANGESLVTRNVRHFRVVAGLTLVTY
jgi:predicted nucleic acid-binding protein